MANPSPPITHPIMNPPPNWTPRGWLPIPPEELDVSEAPDPSPPPPPPEFPGVESGLVLVVGAEFEETVYMDRPWEWDWCSLSWATWTGWAWDDERRHASRMMKSRVCVMLWLIITLDGFDLRLFFRLGRALVKVYVSLLPGTSWVDSGRKC